MGFRSREAYMQRSHAVRPTIGMEVCGEERDCRTFNETLHAAAAGEQSVEADEGS
jgi:hypothetical protein